LNKIEPWPRYTLDPYFIGNRFVMAILDIKAHPLVDLLPDFIDSNVPEEPWIRYHTAFPVSSKSNVVLRKMWITGEEQVASSICKAGRPF